VVVTEFSPPSCSGFLSSEQGKVTGLDYLRKEADVMGMKWEEVLSRLREKQGQTKTATATKNSTNHLELLKNRC